MLNRITTVLIANATSPRNIGDAAMLDQLMVYLRMHIPEGHITIHTADASAYSSGYADRVAEHLYNWSVFDHPTFSSRVLRLAALAVAYASLVFHMPVLIRVLPRELRNLIADYRSADIIVLMGAGYLRTKPGFTQALNLFMQLALFCFAARTSARTIVTPMSFGPFAYEWQARMTARVLGSMDHVFVREDISLALMVKYNLKNIERAHDLALSLSPHKVSRSEGSVPVLGFTVREWFGHSRQKSFEEELACGIASAAQIIGCEVQPIVQVDAAKYGEDDANATRRVVARLTDAGCVVLPIKVIRSVDHALEVYGSLDLLVGMRMHSNILAAVQGVPFVGIGYEHKTEGIAKDLNCSERSIHVEHMTARHITEMAIGAFRAKAEIAKQIKISLATITLREKVHWADILTYGNS